MLRYKRIINVLCSLFYFIELLHIVCLKKNSYAHQNDDGGGGGDISTSFIVFVVFSMIE